MEREFPDARAAVEALVEDGSVLNSEGRWVHMFEQLTSEQQLIDELVNGNVKVDGAWISIAAARRLERPTPKKIAPPAPAAAPLAAQTPAPPPQRSDAQEVVTMSFEMVDNMLETIAMDASVVKQIAAMAGAGASRGAVPAPTAPLPQQAAPMPPAPINAAITAVPDSNLIDDETATFETMQLMPYSPSSNAEATEDFSGRDDLRETAMFLVERPKSS